MNTFWASIVFKYLFASHVSMLFKYNSHCHIKSFGKWKTIISVTVNRINGYIHCHPLLVKKRWHNVTQRWLQVLRIARFWHAQTHVHILPINSDWVFFQLKDNIMSTEIRIRFYQKITHFYTILFPLTLTNASHTDFSSLDSPKSNSWTKFSYFCPVASCKEYRKLAKQYLPLIP